VKRGEGRVSKIEKGNIGEEGEGGRMKLEVAGWKREGD